MTSTKEELWKILADLKNEEVKLFKWFLKDMDSTDSSIGISVAQLENADRHDIVDIMVQRYGGPGALQKSTEILKKIGRNDLVHRLIDLNLRDLEILERESKAKAEQMKTEVKLMIQERRMKISEMKRSAENIRKSAERKTSESIRVFTFLTELVQKSLNDLIEDIHKKQTAVQSQVGDFIRGLEQEISELSKKEADLEKLVQSFVSIDKTLPLPSYETGARTVVNELREKLNKEMERFLNKMRLDWIQQFAVDVTLDPETAHPNLYLSKDHKQVHFSKTKQNLPDTVERFSTGINVLGKQGFSSGRFYFEVQVKGKTRWDLGVVEESISRKGSIQTSPKEGFWAIFLREGNKYGAHSARLHVKTPPHKVGVFVDFETKSADFYDADSGEPIHSFNSCIFTKKLYPFFSPGFDDNGQNLIPLTICPVHYTDYT